MARTVSLPKVRVGDVCQVYDMYSGFVVDVLVSSRVNGLYWFGASGTLPYIFSWNYLLNRFDGGVVGDDYQ